HEKSLRSPPLAAAPGASLAPVRAPGGGGRREKSLHPPDLELLRAGRRSDVLVEAPGLLFRNRALGEPADDERPPPRAPGRDLDPVARPEFPVRFRTGAVHVDLAPLAGPLGPGTGGKDARDVEPDVEADGRGRNGTSGRVRPVRIRRRALRLRRRCRSVPGRRVCAIPVGTRPTGGKRAPGRSGLAPGGR